MATSSDGMLRAHALSLILMRDPLPPLYRPSPLGPQIKGNWLLAKFYLGHLATLYHLPLHLKNPEVRLHVRRRHPFFSTILSVVAIVFEGYKPHIHERRCSGWCWWTIGIGLCGSG
jgi:hypothetical protein